MELTLRFVMDRLGVSVAELADELNVSRQLIRQARMSPEASGYRSAPDGWEDALLRLGTRKRRQADEVLTYLRERGKR